MNRLSRTSHRIALASLAALLLLGGTARVVAEEWREGHRIAATGAAETTRTLTLVRGQSPGQYLIEGSGVRVSLLVFPETAEAPTNLSLSGDADREKLVAQRLKGLEISLRPVDAETFVAEVKAGEGSGALVEAQVAAAEAGTTITLTKLPAKPTLMASVDRDAPPQVVSLFARQVFGRRAEDSASLVAPLLPRESAFVMIAARERKRAELGIGPEPTPTPRPWESPKPATK